MSDKLSTTQIEVLTELRKHPGKKLVRFRGGFWSYEGCETRDSWGSVNQDKVPLWYTTIQTVRSLERKGYLRQLQTGYAEWCELRELTSKGITEEQLS